jgi:hypothetical protein
MARVKGVDIEEVPQEIREILEEQIERHGSVLNTACVYALRPSIYKGVQALGEGIRDSGLIKPELRHLLCVKAAGINGCPY